MEDYSKRSKIFEDKYVVEICRHHNGIEYYFSGSINFHRVIIKNAYEFNIEKYIPQEFICTMKSPIDFDKNNKIVRTCKKEDTIGLAEILDRQMKGEKIYDRFDDGFAWISSYIVDKCKEEASAIARQIIETKVEICSHGFTVHTGKDKEDGVKVIVIESKCIVPDFPEYGIPFYIGVSRYSTKKGDNKKHYWYYICSHSQFEISEDNKTMYEVEDDYEYLYNYLDEAFKRLKTNLKYLKENGEPRKNSPLEDRNWTTIEK